MKNVFTIAPHVSFLDTLATEVTRQNGDDSFRLSQALILLPTRRACRALGTAFARLAAGRPVLLPRLRPLGDVDEDEIAFADDAFPDLPPAISPLHRLMLLTQLVQKRDPSLSCDQAALAAQALARFLDQMQIDNCNPARLPLLVQQRELAAHWQEIVAFLEIVTDVWPRILREEGCLDPAARRNAVMKAQAALWRKNPPSAPVIAAGSTGSIPATAELLAVIADMPQGAVILPGLDRDLDEEAWQAVSDTHPQHSMKKLLETIKISRSDVRDFAPPPPRSPRAEILAASMRPAALTEQWRALRGHLSPEGLQGLSALTLAHPQEEAQTIALRIRAALNNPTATVTFVTADRALASRVTASLRRWDIAADDSGGAPATQSVPGAFLALLLSAAAPQASSTDFLALLKHPLTACGLSLPTCRAQARLAEIALRNPPSGPTTNVLADLRAFLRPLSAIWNAQQPLSTWIDAHNASAESLATTADEAGTDRLWRGEPGNALAEWMSEWRQTADAFPALTGDDYAALFASLASMKILRPDARAAHPRLSILGPLEARLMDADLIILGGMNEGVWPPDAGFDPWMSRPMRRDFGLPAPEFRLGLSAHDFAQLACARDVFITRAARADGAPTTPSRFLSQIDAVLRAAGLSDDKSMPLHPADPWREWAQKLDEPETTAPCPRPQPRPPVDARPKALSVTEIGTWRRNPYAIYAKHVLGLRKLEELDAPLDAADKGNLIHEALEQFLKTYPDTLPDDAQTRLTEMGDALLSQTEGDPRLLTFWHARWHDIAQWFIDTERARRAEGIHPLRAEAKGRIGMGDFTLTGRADRIDRLPDAQWAIVDYKTGSAPTASDVKSGIEPQLALLALIARRGGFAPLPSGEAGTLEYWVLKGGRNGCKQTGVTAPFAALIDRAEEGLRRLIETFNNPETPYEAVPVARLQPRFNDYAHLARLQEWGRTGTDDGGTA